MKLRIWVLGTSILFAPSLLPATVHAGRHIERSHCGGAFAPHYIPAALDLDPWFDRLEDRLKQEKSFKALCSLLEKRFNNGQNAICTLRVNKEGQMSDFVMSETSGIQSIDSRIIKFVSSLRSLEATPNNLPEIRGIQLELWKKGSEIILSTQLDATTRAKRDPVVFYNEPSSRSRYERKLSRSL